MILTCAYLAFQCLFIFSHLQVYNPAKPEKYGIKFYMVCEVESGYCVTFEVYSGKTDEPAGEKLFRLVLRLMNSGRLLDSGRFLYGDLYYSAPQLVKVLLQRQTGYCGTVKPNMQGK